MMRPEYGTHPIECTRCGWRGYETDRVPDPVGPMTYYLCPECDYGSYVFLSDDEADIFREQPAEES